MHLRRATQRVRVLDGVVGVPVAGEQRAESPAARRRLRGAGELPGMRADPDDPVVVRAVGAEQRLHRQRAGDVGGPGQRLGVGHRQREQRLHRLGAVDEREPLLRGEHSGSSPRPASTSAAGRPSSRPSPTSGSATAASWARSPDAPTEPLAGTVGSRSRSSSSSSRSGSSGAAAGRAGRDRAGPQQEQRPDRVRGQRLAGAGGVRADQRQLHRLQVLAGHRDVGERAEPGAHAVHDRAALDRVGDHAPGGGHPPGHVRAELGPGPPPGHVHHVVECEPVAVDENRPHSQDRSAGYPPPVRTLLDWIDRVNAAHPWSHNDHYVPWVLRQLPPMPGTALDVGCGTGTLLAALAARLPHVEGIDRDPAMAARSGARRGRPVRPAGGARVRRRHRGGRAAPPAARTGPGPAPEPAAARRPAARRRLLPAGDYGRPRDRPAGRAGESGDRPAGAPPRSAPGSRCRRRPRRPGRPCGRSGRRRRPRSSAAGCSGATPWSRTARVDDGPPPGQAERPKSASSWVCASAPGAPAAGPPPPRRTGTRRRLRRTRRGRRRPARDPSARPPRSRGPGPSRAPAGRPAAASRTRGPGSPRTTGARSGPSRPGRRPPRSPPRRSRPRRRRGRCRAGRRRNGRRPPAIVPPANSGTAHRFSPTTWLTSARTSHSEQGVGAPHWSSGTACTWSP